MSVYQRERMCLVHLSPSLPECLCGHVCVLVLIPAGQPGPGVRVWRQTVGPRFVIGWNDGVA